MVIKYGKVKKKLILNYLSDPIAEAVLKKKIPNTGVVNVFNMVYRCKIKYSKRVKIAQNSRGLKQSSKGGIKHLNLIRQLKQYINTKDQTTAKTKQIIPLSFSPHSTIK